MSEPISYDKRDLRGIVRALKAMDEQATIEANKIGVELAEKAVDAVKRSASRPTQQRIADGAKAARKSKLGEMTWGYASQRYSGGGTTQQLWGGYEFGSNAFPQFRPWSGREGAGSRGKFIYPTLRRLQPTYVATWEAAFEKIIKEWS